MDQPPTHEDLQVLPELAILVALQAVLQLAVASLLAANPELCDLEPNPSVSAHQTAALSAADSLISLADAMHDAIDVYRQATMCMIKFIPQVPAARLL
jgi:hypothetical protein